MFFKEVIDALAEGKHIRRKEWEPQTTIFHNKWTNEFSKCVCEGFYCFEISREDLKTNDWEIVE